MQYFYIKYDENTNRTDCVKLVDGQGIEWSIPNDSANKDWQEYQAWLAADENNIPQEET